MADLGQRTTSGELAWDKYVYKNKNWKDLNLVLEKDTELGKKVGAKLTKLADVSKGTNIKLKSNITSSIAGKRYASVTINRKDGFIPISKLS